MDISPVICWQISRRLTHNILYYFFMEPSVDTSLPNSVQINIKPQDIKETRTKVTVNLWRNAQVILCDTDWVNEGYFDNALKLSNVLSGF